MILESIWCWFSHWRRLCCESWLNMTSTFRNNHGARLVIGARHCGARCCWGAKHQYLSEGWSDIDWPFFGEIMGVMNRGRGRFIMRVVRLAFKDEQNIHRNSFCESLGLIEVSELWFSCSETLDHMPKLAIKADKNNTFYNSMVLK